MAQSMILWPLVMGYCEVFPRCLLSERCCADVQVSIEVPYLLVQTSIYSVRLTDKQASQT